MTSVRKIAFVALALMGLTSCAGLEDDGSNKAVSVAVVQQSNIAPQAQQKPAPAIKPNFSCTGGLKFNASFSHDKRFAYIVFLDSAVRHRLRSTNVASGFEYSNGKLIYREYKGQTTLMDLSQDATKPAKCHKILTSEKPSLRGVKQDPAQTSVTHHET